MKGCRCCETLSLGGVLSDFLGPSDEDITIGENETIASSFGSRIPNNLVFFVENAREIGTSNEQRVSNVLGRKEPVKKDVASKRLASKF